VLLLAGLSGTAPAYAACTTTPGCGGTPPPSPTPTDTDVKPTDSVPPPSSGPTVSASPDATTSPVSGPPTVSGSFTLGSGAPLAGSTVQLTAVDSVPADGSFVTPAVVGTATTAANGSWSFTLPATLPASLQTLADANGGVLALEANVNGTAPDGTVLTGSDYVDAGVASGSATTDGSVAARQEIPDTVQIHPDVSTTAVTPTNTGDGTPADQDSGDTAADNTNQAAWQSADGTSTAAYNPDVVNGVNYATASPSVANCSVKNRVVGTSVQYTTVGEGHAYYDTTAAFEYNNTLSSTWGVAVSVDGKVWTVKGKISRKSSTGHATGFTGKGPYWAQQFRVPIQYEDYDHELLCPNGRVVHNYSIIPVKYMVPAGQPVSAFGSDVRKYDGPTAYGRSVASHRAVLTKSSYYSIISGTSITYSLAVKVFNVELSLDTDFSNTHFQKISAGNGRYEHDIWGGTGPVYGNPGVLYSD
jgi:hypothetical protein